MMTEQGQAVLKPCPSLPALPLGNDLQPIKPISSAVCPLALLQRLLCQGGPPSPLQAGECQAQETRLSTAQH